MHCWVVGNGLDIDWRTLPCQELRVVGCWYWGMGPALDALQADAVLQSAVEAGITGDLQCGGVGYDREQPMGLWLLFVLSLAHQPPIFKGQVGGNVDRDEWHGVGNNTLFVSSLQLCLSGGGWQQQ